MPHLQRSLVPLLLVLTTHLSLVACDKKEKDGGAGTKAPVCESSLECNDPALPHCDGFVGCVACVLDDHCPIGQRCDEHECGTPASCVSSADCDDPSRAVCNYILAECVQCTIAADCGDSAICDEGKCVEVTPCVNSLGCAEGTVCERDYGYCVDCVDDADCDTEHTCVDLECIPRCTSDKNCTAAGELCDKAAGYCVECVESEDCPALYHCSSGQCKADTCLQGTERCNEDTNTAEICDAVGSTTSFDYCDFGTTCTELGQLTHCQSWLCTPGSATCDPTGNDLITCDADGLNTSVSAHCDEQDGVCENNACVDIVCEPSARFCMDATVMQCSASGTAFSSIQSCALTEFCDRSTGSCVPQLCTPGTVACSDNQVIMCKADGSGVGADKIDCEDYDQTCFNGACEEQICEPSERFCQDGDAYDCLDNGTRESKIDDCTELEYCEKGVCKADSCVPGEPTCAEDVIGVCNAEGNEVTTKSSSTDCSDTDQVCWAGTCQDKVCEPGTQFCADDTTRICQHNGTSSILGETCGSQKFCNDSTATPSCVTNICTPNSPSCDANRATTCNADGSGYLEGGTVCGNSELCVSGTCLPVICDANQYYCNASGNVRRCGSDGTTESAVDTCLSGEYCSPGSSACQQDKCTAGQPICDGNLLTTCATNGSGPVSGGIACATGKACVTNQCLDVFCTPGEEYCSGNDLRKCNATGTGYSSSSSCGSANYCSLIAEGDAECLPDLCQAGTQTCSGEQLATCGADGGSYTSLSTDCALTSQLCSGTTCVDTLVETVGGTTGSNSLICSGYRLANEYHFGSARTLTQIQQYLAIGGTEQLTWFIYEIDRNSYLSEPYYDYDNYEYEYIYFSFTKVFEKLTTNTGTQFHSSGALSFELDPSKVYMIGVRPGGACTAYNGGLTKTYWTSGYVGAADAAYDFDALDTSWGVGAYDLLYNQRLSFE